MKGVNWKELEEESNGPVGESYEEWERRFREWVASHRSRNPEFDEPGEHLRLMRGLLDTNVLLRTDEPGHVQHQVATDPLFQKGVAWKEWQGRDCGFNSARG